MSAPKLTEAMRAEMARQLGPIEIVTMPRLPNGKRPPNPRRYACRLGHVHPSRKAANACRQRYFDRGEKS